MAHEKEIKETMLSLQKATARHIGIILHAKGLVGSMESGDATCRKPLADLITKGEIKKEGSCFMLPHLTGFQEHDRKLTECLTEFLKRWECVVYREHSIEEVKLRPDALIMAKHEGKKALIVLEVLNHEKPEYLKQKIDVWKSWKDALRYLGKLFDEEMECFDFVTSGKRFDGHFELKDYLNLLEEK